MAAMTSSSLERGGCVRVCNCTPAGVRSRLGPGLTVQRAVRYAQSSRRRGVVPNASPAPPKAPSRGDPFGLLFQARTVFLGGEVEDVGADALVSQILLLDSQEPGKDIKMYINSPGGSVTAGMGIYDAMQMCRSDVSTHCFGLAASMGAFLLGAGQKGKRYSMPNARIMIHQPLGGASGQALDIEIQAKEIMYHKARLNGIIAQYTGQPLTRVEADTDRDKYLDPIAARDYGIIDHIVGGDENVIQVQGSSRRFPEVKERYLFDRYDLTRHAIMDGEPFLPRGASWRFRKRQREPYLPAMQPGERWFVTTKVSKEEYKKMLEEQRNISEGKTNPRKLQEPRESA